MVTFGIQQSDVFSSEDYVRLATFVNLDRKGAAKLIAPYSVAYRWRTMMDDMETDRNTQAGLDSTEERLLDSVEGDSESPTTETEAELEVELTEAELSTDSVAVPGYNFISVVAV
jgi:hypothetical protein